MKCTIVFAAILISGTAADNCQKIADHYKLGAHTLKTDLKNLYCKDATGTTTAASDACVKCCEAVKDTCFAHALSVATRSKCNATTHHFSSEGGKGISQATFNLAATKTTFVATCCQKKATCSGYGCAAWGWKNKATMATIPCDGLKSSSCKAPKCCDADTTKCGSHSGTKTCGDVLKMADPSKLAAVVKTDGSDYATVCCKDAPAAVTRANCSLACPAGKGKKTGYATTLCAGAACDPVKDEWACCEWLKATCGYVQGAKGKTCGGADSLFYDKSKVAVAAKDDGTDFDANCCTKATTCAAFAGASIGSASLANTERASVVTVLLMLAGGILA